MQGRVGPDPHNEDYSKPLEVVWLCKSCHKRLHLGLITRERVRQIIRDHTLKVTRTL